MKTLHCTGKELSDRSGISSSIISRYRNGEREPQMDSEIVITLAHTLTEIAAEKNIETMSEETILSAFQNALYSKSRDYETFLRRFNTLYEELHLNMKDLSAFTHFDTSFLYRIKSGERKTSNLPAFCDSITKFLVNAHSSCMDKEKIAGIIGINYNSIIETTGYYTAIYQWLLPNGDKSEAPSKTTKSPASDISQFLVK